MDKAVSRLPTNKSVGVDIIPNEILKFEDEKQVLFNKCFNLGKVPSICLEAVTILVHKGSTKDPCVPLTYRGISL